MQKAQAAKRMWDSMAAGFAQRPLLDEENSFTMQLSHTQKDVLQAFLRERAKDSVLEEETVTTVTAIYCNVNK